MTDEMKTTMRRLLGDLYRYEHDAESLQRILMATLEAMTGLDAWEAANLNEAEDELKPAARAKR